MDRFSVLCGSVAVFGCLLTPVQGQNTSPRSAKVGNLLIEVADVSTPPDGQGSGLRTEGFARRVAPPVDHYFIAVALNVINVGRKHIICARFEATLVTEAGSDTDLVQREAPFVERLLPNQAVRGRYVFTVKRGERPVTLRLAPEAYSEGCREQAGVQLRPITRAEFRIGAADLPRK